MTNKCCDIGTIQAFLDGELDFERSEAVAHHVAACDDCAIMLAVAEEESSFAFDALEQEFNTLVPTQRLWTKINDSIEQEKKSFWTPIFAFFKQPSIAAFAGLIVVVGLFALVVYRGTIDETNLALNDPPQKVVVNPIVNPTSATPTNAQLRPNRRRVVQNFLLVWLDANIDSASEDSQHTLQNLRSRAPDGMG